MCIFLYFIFKLCFSVPIIFTERDQKHKSLPEWLGGRGWITIITKNYNLFKPSPPNFLLPTERSPQKTCSSA